MPDCSAARPRSGSRDGRDTWRTRLGTGTLSFREGGSPPRLVDHLVPADLGIVVIRHDVAAAIQDSLRWLAHARDRSVLCFNHPVAEILRHLLPRRLQGFDAFNPFRIGGLGGALNHLAHVFAVLIRSGCFALTRFNANFKSPEHAL